MLLKAVSVQHKVSPRAEDDLGERMAAVFNSLGDQEILARLLDRLLQREQA